MHSRWCRVKKQGGESERDSAIRVGVPVEIQFFLLPVAARSSTNRKTDPVRHDSSAEWENQHYDRSPPGGETRSLVQLRNIPPAARKLERRHHAGILEASAITNIWFVISMYGILESGLLTIANSDW